MAGPRVEVTFGDSDLQTMQPVVSELLARHDVKPSFRGVAPIELHEVVESRQSSPYLAHVWIDRRSHGELTLYVANGRTDRVLVRTVSLEDGELDEVARETVAHILEATVEAILSGRLIGQPRDDVRRELGVEPEAPPRAESEPAVTTVGPPPQEPRPLSLGLGYQVRAVAAGLTLHGLHLTLQYALWSAREAWLRIGIEGVAYLPDRWSSMLVDAKVVGGAGWLDLAVGIRLLDGFYASLRGGLGTSLLHVTPRRADEETLQPSDGTEAVSLLLRILGGVRWQPQQARWGLALEGGITLDPTDLRFVVTEGDVVHPVLTPRTVQVTGAVAIFLTF